MDSAEFCVANDDQANYDEEMASVYAEIDVKYEPLFPSLECDQAFHEKIAIEMNIIREADIEVDSEEFCDANDDQANYDKEMASVYDEIGRPTFSPTYFRPILT